MNSTETTSPSALSATRSIPRQGGLTSGPEDGPDTFPDPMRTLVPEGRYSVAYVKLERGQPHGREVFFVCFNIVEPAEHCGKPTLRFINRPKLWISKRIGAKTARGLPRSSSLFLDYVAIKGTLPPCRVFKVENLYADYQRKPFGEIYPGELLFVARKA